MEKTKIKLFFLSFIFIFPALIFSQQQKIDSLNAIIKKAESDTLVARAYISLVDLLYGIKPDTILYLSNQTIAVADKALPAAKGEVKKTLLLLKSAALGNTGYYYYQAGNTPKAMEFFHAGLKIQEEINDEKEIANSLNNIAAIYYKTGETQKSLEYFEKALAIQRKIGVKEGIAYSLNNIGGIYDAQGQIKKALEYYFEGLKLQEELGNKMGMGTSLNNIAAILVKQGEKEKGIEYYNKSLAVRTEAGDKRGIAQCLNNLGHIMTTSGKLDEALSYFEKSFALYKEIGNLQGIAYSYNNMASVYKYKKDYQKALELFAKSAETYEKAEDKRGLATALNNTGALLQETGQPAKGLSYSLRALEIAKAGGFAEITRDIHSVLSRIYDELNKPAEALNHYKEFIVFRDSLNNIETKKAGIRKQVEYEYDKKEQEIKSANEKKELLRREEIKRKNILIWSVAGISFLALLSIVLLFNRKRLRQKNIHQQQLAQQQKEQAVAVMETQEQERKRIAEDLHDSLGHLLSTAKYNLQSIPQQEIISNSVNLINQAAEEIRNITFNLMPRTLEEEGLVAALNELAAKVNQSGKVQIFLQVHNISQFVLDKQSQFNIYRIIQEAVNNILKHADASEINIQLSGQDKSLLIIIEDDGKGFNSQAPNKGRGLKNIVTRSLWLRGQVNIDSTPGKGTTITTEIPTEE